VTLTNFRSSKHTAIGWTKTRGAGAFAQLWLFAHSRPPDYSESPKDFGDVHETHTDTERPRLLANHVGENSRKDQRSKLSHRVDDVVRTGGPEMVCMVDAPGNATRSSSGAPAHLDVVNAIADQQGLPGGHADLL